MRRLTLISTLTGMVMAMPAMGQVPTSILVNDGTEKVVFALDEKPTVTYGASSVTFATATRTVEYALDTTVTVTFVEDAGIAAPTVAATFDISGGEIRATGLRANEVVSIYAYDGRLVLTERADSNGAWSVSVDRLPAEPLIVKTEKQAFKFKIQK